MRANWQILMEANNNKGCVVTIGFFDGVHLGHRYLAECLRKEAASRGLQSRIVTFQEHPRQVLQSEYRPLLLTTLEKRMSLLHECGVDICTALHFTPRLAKMDARTFMSDILCSKLNARCLLLGHDHCFGHDRISGLEAYRQIGMEIGLEVIAADAYIWQDKPVSSSRIRACMAQGNVVDASTMLGYRYSLSGTVVHGLKNGRKMGFPTANLAPVCELLQIPANGVYSAWASVGGETFKAMLNIGFRPTVDGEGKRRTIEAHLLDFDRDIYGEELTLSFVDYIRNEQRFDGLEALAGQLRKDRDIINDKLSQELLQSK